jgi:hypothetical protein
VMAAYVRRLSEGPGLSAHRPLLLEPPCPPKPSAFFPVGPSAVDRRGSRLRARNRYEPPCLPHAAADPGDDLRDLARPQHRRTHHQVTDRLRPLSHIGTTRPVLDRITRGVRPVGQALATVVTDSAHRPRAARVNRGDGRGRHPPQERPRPSRGTGRAAARTSYSVVDAFSVTPGDPPTPSRGSCILYGHGRAAVSGRNVPFAPSAEARDHRNRRRPRGRDHRLRNHACWGMTRS